MNLGENIYAAFDIVTKTYENVNKLMDYCRATVAEKGEFVLASPKFLRWKSDTEVSGWYIRSFILLFQNANNRKLDNGWYDGPVYVLEINLFNPGVYEVPTVNIAKYEYADIKTWSGGCSPANHWIFFDPLYHVLEFEQEGVSYSGSVIDTEDADRRYWGLRRITGIEVPLTDITSENSYEIIFGGFHSLKDK